MLKRAANIDHVGPVHDIVVEGFTKITASEMAAVLRECTYERQRKISAEHVNVLADIMRRGTWVERGSLDFAQYDGRLILVNGHHRGHAQVQCGRDLEWSICIRPCQSFEDVEALYYAFDTNVRQRTKEQILHGSGFAEQNGLTPTTAKAVFGAVSYIAARFSTSRSDQDYLTNRVMDLRFKVAVDFSAEALIYEACIAGASSALRRKLLNSGTTAVALVTLKYQPDLAREFWTGVALNDGLRRYDPRHTLVNDLQTRTMNSGWAHAATAAPAVAWNAFFEKRELKIIKVIDTPQVRIFGTPFDGRK